MDRGYAPAPGSGQWTHFNEIIPHLPSMASTHFFRSLFLTFRRCWRYLAWRDCCPFLFLLGPWKLLALSCLVRMILFLFLFVSSLFSRILGSLWRYLALVRSTLLLFFSSLFFWNLETFWRYLCLVRLVLFLIFSLLSSNPGICVFCTTGLFFLIGVLLWNLGFFCNWSLESLESCIFGLFLLGIRSFGS